MHIPDGYLGPQTYGAMYAVMTPLWWRAAVKVRAAVPKKNLPLVALAGAFSFIIMLFNIPVPGGTTGHAVGGALAAIVLGPWSAMVAISTAVVIQALVFGDGGITSIAANCFTIAFISPFSAFYIYRLIAGGSAAFGRRQRAGAFIAGYASLTLAAMATGLLFGLQPLIAAAAGQPLYAPYPISVTVPAMAVSHLLFFGPLEGAVTALVAGHLAGAAGPVRLGPQRVALGRDGGGS